MIAASVAEVWDVYFDAPRLAGWVDGFGHVEDAERRLSGGGRDAALAVDARRPRQS